MKTLAEKIACGLIALLMLCAAPAQAWEMRGEKTLLLEPRAGSPLRLGTIVFTPAGELTQFEIKLDHQVFKDYFLSMKEFKCIEGQSEIQCHVPYPYANPRTVSAADLRWLEHELLFLFKTPNEFGARLWNGLYYRLRLSNEGLVGTPEAVDLAQIGAPPVAPSPRRPVDAALRTGGPFGDRPGNALVPAAADSLRSALCSQSASPISSFQRRGFPAMKP